MMRLALLLLALCALTSAVDPKPANQTPSRQAVTSADMGEDEESVEVADDVPDQPDAQPIDEKSIGYDYDATAHHQPSHSRQHNADHYSSRYPTRKHAYRRSHSSYYDPRPTYVPAGSFYRVPNAYTRSSNNRYGAHLAVSRSPPTYPHEYATDPLDYHQHSSSRNHYDYDYPQHSVEASNEANAYRRSHHRGYDRFTRAQGDLDTSGQRIEYGFAELEGYGFKDRKQKQQYDERPRRYYARRRYRPARRQRRRYRRRRGGYY